MAPPPFDPQEARAPPERAVRGSAAFPRRVPMPDRRTVNVTGRALSTDGPQAAGVALSALLRDGHGAHADVDGRGGLGPPSARAQQRLGPCLGVWLAPERRRRRPPHWGLERDVSAQLEALAGCAAALLDVEDEACPPSSS